MIVRDCGDWLGPAQKAAWRAALEHDLAFSSHRRVIVRKTSRENQ
jgi:hypothetical protein